MRFAVRDPYSEVIWMNGDITGHGPAYKACFHAFIYGEPFMLTPTGPEITPNVMDPVSALLTIRWYGFMDTRPEEEGVPPGVYLKIEEMTRLPLGVIG
jgi:hypothetical protein